MLLIASLTPKLRTAGRNKGQSIFEYGQPMFILDRGVSDAKKPNAMLYLIGQKKNLLGGICVELGVTLNLLRQFETTIFRTALVAFITQLPGVRPPHELKGTAVFNVGASINHVKKMSEKLVKTFVCLVLLPVLLSIQLPQLREYLKEEPDAAKHC